MGLYSKYILPKLINWACSQTASMKQRDKVIPLAEGNVLEIGIGSGFSLPFYDKSRVLKLTAIDPSGELWDTNKTDIESLGFEFEFIETAADSIPLKDNIFDSAVITYTLCTITNVEIALKEIRRVLKPEGKLFFCEHGLAPDRGLQLWQNVINPFWKRVGGGCNLNRDIPNILKSNGFEIERLNARYLTGWKPASYNYWGSANVS